MISQFLLSLTILVVLHECGHYFPARWFKTRVEKFYLFFDPWFSLFKKKIGDTEYGIGWLPLGGYVKISGMVDESFDTEQLKNEPQPWEFRSKPAWQRLIIMLGGVTVNFILGFLIFAFMLWIYGKEYLPNQELKYGISVDSLSYQMGFRDGDQILKLGDKEFKNFDRSRLLKALVLDEVHSVTINRRDQEMILSIDPVLIQQLTKPEVKNMDLWGVRIPAHIDKVSGGQSAEKAGMQSGDQFLSIDGQPTQYIHEVVRLLKDQSNREFQMGLLRGNDTVQLNVTTNENGKIGVQWSPATNFFKTERENYSFFQSLPLGVIQGWELLTSQLKAFGQMFQGKIKAKDSLGGFASIANMFEKTWDWESFWRMTAILSIMLGFMNLLPIPALDGGYVVFLLIELISGRKVSDKIIEKATLIGFILLIGLLLYANGLDIMRFSGK